MWLLHPCAQVRPTVPCCVSTHTHSLNALVLGMTDASGGESALVN